MLPKVNQVLYYQVQSIDDEEARMEFKSRIADMSSDMIHMEIPINEKSGRLKKLFPGDELSVYFITEGGIKHYFQTSVTGFKEDVVRLVTIRMPKPDSISKIQRRSFLRVPADLELSVRTEGHPLFLAATEDVSGGGISFLCPQNANLKEGARISCWLLLQFRGNKPDHVQFEGEIVRIHTLETGRKIAMVKFIEITERDRQTLIRFCFERQLEFRKQ
ncbi:hypothetical protein J31TS4_07750 [Paenibacillus sp. J31TS4]|uniref:flagellar brake protein n=1 Tax=Paenibacillus sp. J31TS4 TaxID=2807195 RepID=UPI001B250849|nr:PilZ domain-containing protein [Paenibacillus sp. J31TS4]GIP37495.1 hypothetical protein J31TS4_07750 [Paenibacillus sp. J31TS4]